jgi:uncharacterized membrane protein
MAETGMALYTAVYDSVPPALEDLDAIEELHKESMIGKYDAAVIDQEEGKPHIVKRMDRPRVRVIPEMFGGGALPRKELKEAAQELTSDQAGLIVVGEPTIEQGFDKAVTRAARIVKHSVDATSDEIASELKEALKETS